ncbi:MAG: disulfide oxidoreductase, partial [Alphaproteobacteria bacterium]|nr:disulfide oxidoreductase [Alphaproteobacteria bacterium]
LALERMLGHATGMIGFPLRLLARENYDRIVRAKGAQNVALVTGEERIVPPGARWFVCTTEAMPLGGAGGREVAFLAIDEIQLISDRERGHVFTDRLLNARGYAETMVLGAGTAKPVIRRLVPHAEFVERPRLSTLSYSGPKKITRLPRRSAVVAFSANDVYRIAELIRRQRGGAAVVFGALSPRTRNAQVAMYQAGEVDYLVATDAIGMGLNMDIDHVAFAELTKFDGRHPRRLAAAELGQIAGRAGRHMTDGTFGTTAEIGGLEPEIVTAIEEHRFPPITHAFWRNAALDFGSIAGLLESLEARPPSPELVRARTADDHAALTALAGDEDVVAAARGRARLALLWEACQIPDFRKSFDGSHARFVKRVFLHLVENARLPTDWVAGQVARLDTVEGDIDSLLQRIAAIRTWTYVAHKPAWLDDPLDWQARTRVIEDKLSDALHARLTQRFVDRRAATVARRRAAGEALLAGVTRTGAVVVEGEAIGALSGFAFVGERGSGEGTRAMMAAANRVVRQDIAARVRRLVQAADDAITLSLAGELVWEEAAVARLAAGAEALTPRVEVLSSDLLEGPNREAIRRRLAAWVDAHLTATLAPLFALRAAALAGPARGLAYELVAQFGCAPRARVAPLVAALSPAERGQLQRLGVILGDVAVFMPAMRNHATLGLRAVLWRLFAGEDVGAPVPAPALSHPRAEGQAGAFFQSQFCLPAGPRFVRVDRLERLAREAFRRARNGAFAADPAWAAAIGAPPEQLDGVLRALGLRGSGEGEARLYGLKPRARRRHNAEIRREAVDENSPFAGLAKLVRR